MEELLTRLVKSDRFGDIEDFVLRMIWLSNAKHTISKYFFKYWRTLETVQATLWAMTIYEETIKVVRDAKRAMEKGDADVCMSGCAPLFNVSLTLLIFV